MLSWLHSRAADPPPSRVFPGEAADKACYGTPMGNREVRRRADAAAANFDGVDFVHAHARDGLLDRLQPIVIDADLVLDLGTATGSAVRALATRFRGARILGIDVSHNMLARARRKQGWLGRKWFVQADAGHLPLPDTSVDVVFANMLLPGIGDPLPLFAEVNRVLREGGLFAFSTLGPDSLLELRRAWQRPDPAPRGTPFPDMHDVGDAAVRSGLRDPVLDVDRLTVTYRDAAAAFRDLTEMGGRDSRHSSNRGLVSRARHAAMLGALEHCRKDGLLTFELELVFGHCWGSGRPAGAAEFRIEPTSIKRRRD